jgi:hypothetical protein
MNGMCRSLTLQSSTSASIIPIGNVPRTTVVMGSKGEPSAYAKAMKADRLDKQRRRRNQGVRAQVSAHGGAKCGANKRGGGTCHHAAGFGTSHLGIGRCKYHGGTTRAHTANAAKQEAVLLGAPKEINPLDAILWCIRLSAGEIEFYTEQMAMLEEKDWFEDTIMGKQMHIMARERGIAQERLVKFSKTAIDLGLAERAVRLAEQFGNTIARLLHGLLDDLDMHMSAEGKKMIPMLIRKHLLLAEQIHPDVVVPPKVLTK